MTHAHVRVYLPNKQRTAVSVVLNMLLGYLPSLYIGYRYISEGNTLGMRWEECLGNGHMITH